MDLQQLLAYTHELEYQNSQLKKHIFNIQQQLQEKTQAIQLLHQKNKAHGAHIQLCQNQIIKRETREAQLLQELQYLKRDNGIYIEQIDTLKNQLNRHKQENQAMLREISRRGNGVPPKAESTKKKSRESEEREQQRKTDYYATDNRSQKRKECSQCQILMGQNTYLLFQCQKLKASQYQLQKDIQCLIDTISPDT